MNLLITLILFSCILQQTLADVSHLDRNNKNRNYLPPDLDRQGSEQVNHQVERVEGHNKHVEKKQDHHSHAHDHKKSEHRHHDNKSKQKHNRSHAHATNDHKEFLDTSATTPSVNYFPPARSDFPTAGSELVYANAPNSLFHTQINLQSQDSDFTTNAVQLPNGVSTGALLPTNGQPGFPGNGQLGGGQFPANGGGPTFPGNNGQLGGGQFPTNGGQFPGNGGQFPSNGGGQLAGGQFPINGGQFPINGGQFPINGGQFPANGGQFPTNGGQFPANGGQFPTNGGQFPANGGQFPTNGGGPALPGNNGQLAGGQFPANGGTLFPSFVVVPGFKPIAPYRSTTQPDGTGNDSPALVGNGQLTGAPSAANGSGTRSAAPFAVLNFAASNRVETSEQEPLSREQQQRQQRRQKQNKQGYNVIHGSVADDNLSTNVFLPNHEGNSQGVNIIGGNILGRRNQGSRTLQDTINVAATNVEHSYTRKSSHKKNHEEKTSFNTNDDFQYEPSAANAPVIIYKPGDQIDFNDVPLREYNSDEAATSDTSYAVSDTNLRADGYHYEKPKVTFTY